ncbi:MAG: spore germination protein, partial [Oscillospiraceae bacterium]
MKPGKTAKKFEPDETGAINYGGAVLTSSLEENVALIKQIFARDATVIERRVENRLRPKARCCLFFIDGMANNQIIDEYIVKPIVDSTTLGLKDNPIEALSRDVLVANDVRRVRAVEELVKSLIAGDTLVFAEGSSEGLVVSTKGYETRAVTEPDSEKALRGPREGFTESILVNLSLLRRKLRTPDLKMEFKTIGTRSNTRVCICYLESLTDPALLEELERRLDQIEIDGILDSNYISELIKDAPASPFKTIGSTERPDVVAGKLLEGRIALILDGTPMALTLPYLFIETFQANDDYYLNCYFASISRILRIFGFLMTVSIPAVYIAFVTFHREMIPTDLALSVMEARQGVPFPTALECFLMLIIFEIIRETGVRMPSNIGQALSIVGALVVGQAAVEAKLVSAPMVIVVATTAITGLINPKVKGAAILFRFIALFAASFLGLFGYAFAM